MVFFFNKSLDLKSGCIPDGGTAQPCGPTQLRYEKSAGKSLPYVNVSALEFRQVPPTRLKTPLRICFWISKAPSEF